MGRTAVRSAFAAVLALSLFVPLCISTGGNSGSQAATLITRALALGQITPGDWWRTFRHELLVGLALGTTLGVIGILRRLCRKLRAAFPHATLRVRLDGGFATPGMFTFLETEGVEYVVAMASNPRLEKRVRRLRGKARMRGKASGNSAVLRVDAAWRLFTFTAAPLSTMIVCGFTSAAADRGFPC